MYQQFRLMRRVLFSTLTRFKYPWNFDSHWGSNDKWGNLIVLSLFLGSSAWRILYARNEQIFLSSTLSRWLRTLFALNSHQYTTMSHFSSSLKRLYFPKLFLLLFRQNSSRWTFSLTQIYFSVMQSYSWGRHSTENILLLIFSIDEQIQELVQIRQICTSPPGLRGLWFILLQFTALSW